MAAYELDDGPLTDEQLEAIRKASPASGIPEESFTQHLFLDNKSFGSFEQELEANPIEQNEQLKKLLATEKRWASND